MTPGSDRVRRIPHRPATAVLLALAAAAQAGSPVTLTGEVRATSAEAILVPPANMSPVVLRYFAPEGATVQPGDVLVRIDPGEALTQVDALQGQIEQADARAAKEIAELELKALDAERAELDAWLAFEKAGIDAAIPREHLSALDADRHRGELERSRRELALKTAERQNAQAAVARRREDAALETGKLRADLLFHQAELSNAEQRATRAGVVVHGFDHWRGNRYDEGSSANPGGRIGEVVGPGAMEVRAWALEPDRAALAEGQPVQLHFDAVPGMTASGRIERISGAPEPKAEWGDGRYFSVDISLVGDSEATGLLPGMSARVELQPAAASPEAAP